MVMRKGKLRRIHTKKFERCVKAVEASGKGRYNPYAVCTASLDKGAFLKKR